MLKMLDRLEADSGIERPPPERQCSSISDDPSDTEASGDIIPSGFDTDDAVSAGKQRQLDRAITGAHI